MKGADTPIAALGNRTWAELELEQHPEGGLLFKDELRRKTPTGELERIPVRVRVPRPRDKVQARTDARTWFLAQKTLDPDRDKDLFDEMEQVCLLARAIRTASAPFAQFAAYDDLAAYDEGSLQDILGRCAVYGQLLDPRDGELDEETVWTKAFQVARVGHLGPLTDIAGPAQPSFMLRMVKEACSSATGLSFARSFGISTQASLAATS